MIKVTQQTRNRRELTQPDKLNKDKEQRQGYLSMPLQHCTGSSSLSKKSEKTT